MAILWAVGRADVKNRSRRFFVLIALRSIIARIHVVSSDLLPAEIAVLADVGQRSVGVRAVLGVVVWHGVDD